MLYFIHMVVGGWPVSHLLMDVTSPTEQLATDFFVSEGYPFNSSAAAITSKCSINLLPTT
jgi:hypothetical protein